MTFKAKHPFKKKNNQKKKWAHTVWRQNADPFMCSCAGTSNEYLTFDAPERSRGHYGSLFSPLKKTLYFSSLRSWNLKICNSRFWNNNLELPVMGFFFFLQLWKRASTDQSLFPSCNWSQKKSKQKNQICIAPWRLGSRNSN